MTLVVQLPLLAAVECCNRINNMSHCRESSVEVKRSEQLDPSTKLTEVHIDGIESELDRELVHTVLYTMTTTTANNPVDLQAVKPAMDQLRAGKELLCYEGMIRQIKSATGVTVDANAVEELLR